MLIPLVFSASKDDSICIWSVPKSPIERGEEQNREEREMAQKELEGGRNWGKKKGGGRKCEVNV